MKRRLVKLSYVIAPLLSATALGVAALTLSMSLGAVPSTRCPPEGRRMARVELVFGTARPSGSPVSGADWQSFLDEVVTPRFPAGLTVLTANGQWRGTGIEPVKERSHILVIWHTASPDLSAGIEAVRSAYRVRFDQESVMRVDSLSCVVF